ncbi:MAG: GNAT family N-acetyltransferase [Oscillospiraceae bacterium]|jgi:RimJ/RimL family protein N-acetyltransferase|nr:GNAT family N-acetyltransferase [Oscillospiraceae bacterium]
MTLETERLLLRPYELDDAPAVHAYAGAPENVCYMAWAPNASLEATREVVQSFLAQAEKEPRLNYDFAVTLRNGGQLIGGCGIYLQTAWFGPPFEGELGWILHRDHWKQGYGTELARALVRFGFETLKLHRITAPCYAENYGSYRIMENAGLSLECIRRQAIRDRDGNWNDRREYAILEDEWNTAQEG